MQIDTISFILGAFLLFVSILGGGLEIKEIKIPRVGRLARGLSALMGASFVAISLWTGGFVVSTPVNAPVAQHQSLPPAITQADTSLPALPQQVPQQLPQQQLITQPASTAQALATQPIQPVQPATPLQTVKTQTTKASATVAATPATIQPKQNSEDKALAKLKQQNAKLRKKIAFTIKAGLGSTANSAETETEMRIYLEGEQAATFLLNSQSPSRSISLKLDKPGKYKYYIEGHSSWNNIPNKKIPMEGKGELTIERGGIYELWSTAAPTAKTQTWEVGLRSKQ